MKTLPVPRTGQRAAFGILQKKFQRGDQTRVSKSLAVSHFVMLKLVPQSREAHSVSI